MSYVNTNYEYPKLTPAHKRIVRTSGKRAPSEAKADVNIVKRKVIEVDLAGKEQEEVTSLKEEESREEGLMDVGRDIRKREGCRVFAEERHEAFPIVLLVGPVSDGRKAISVFCALGEDMPAQLCYCKGAVCA